MSGAIFAYLGEPFQREQAIKEKTQALEAKESLENFVLEGAKLSAGQLQEAVFAPSLFEPGRWVLIRQAHEFTNADVMIRLLNKPLPPSVYVLLDFEKLDKRSVLFKWLKKDATLHEFAALDRRTLPGKIKDLLTQKKVRLDSDAFQYLVATVQPDMLHIQNEVQKLALFQGSQPLTLAQVQGVLFGGQHANVFQFFDTLGGRRPAALAQLKALLEGGEEPSKLYYMLATHMRGLLMLKSLEDAGLSHQDIAKQSGLAPWMLNRRLPQIKQWTLPELMHAIHLLHENDLGIKQGQFNANDALLELILYWVSRSSRARQTAPV